METRLLALQLFLDALGIDPAVETLDERKLVQKAVYLGQALSGVDLSYRFGWHALGPYSPALARDYYSLRDALSARPDEPTGTTAVLRKPIKDSLQRIRPLLSPPDGAWPGKQSDWLELLASWHFLRNVRGFDFATSAKVMEAQKPQLMPSVELAETTLAEIQRSLESAAAVQ